jgi:nucleoporin NUP82
VDGTCLVTTTDDAIVRVWELTVQDRYSFNEPKLSIDLKKLVDGTSQEQDFRASTFGVKHGFSADSFEMEVASACFGGRGFGEESGWAPMTLWIAMREGDVYALCPLLPSKWQPPSTLIPSLSVSIVSKTAAIQNDTSVPEDKRRLAQQQFQWMADLDNQDALTPSGEDEDEVLNEIYKRPDKPGAIPKLQGPFEIELGIEDDDMDTLVTDIYVIGPKVDAEDLMLGEEEDLDVGNVEGLSLGIVCLVTNKGRVTICLDADGLEAQWLPQKKVFIINA